MQLRRSRSIILVLALIFGFAASGSEAAPRLIKFDPAADPTAPALELVGHDRDGCRVQLHVPSLTIEEVEREGESFQALAIPGGGLSGDPGEPGLPTCSGMLAVPDGRELHVEARVIASASLADMRPLPIATEAADEFLPNKTTAGDRPVVSLGEPAVMHGVTVVPFTVRPVRYEAESATLTVATQLDLAFSFGAAKAAAETPQRDFIPESFDDLFAATVLNWDEIRGDATVGPGTWLAICPNSSIAGYIDPLVAWRKRQGYNVIVATMTEIGGSNSAIKNYIQTVYDTVDPSLEFICLVGDATGSIAVPCWYENLSWYHGEGDHYYTTLEGGDQLADAHIGRLTCRTTTELQNIVAKIIGYETTPPTFEDPGWFTRATLTGDPSSSGITTIYVNQWVKSQLDRIGYTQIDTIWSYPFASDMLASCNQGVSVFAYRGYLGFSGFSTGYIDGLDNGLELPFAVVPTCASGSFASTSHTYTEAFLRNPDGGAIGAIGTATTGTHTRYNNTYFEGVWEGMLNENNRHLGAGHTRGKLELYRQFAANEPDIPEIWSMWNNLMGDPETEMWQALPKQLQVLYPATLPVGAGALSVTVNGPFGAVAGARVAAVKDGEIRATAYTDENGHVTLPLTAHTAGSLLVTVTGADLYPYQGAVTLGSIDAFANLEAWQLDDTAGGDGDGIANPGESIELQLALRNLGSELAGGVTVAVASESEHLAVTQATASFGDIAPGDLVWGGPFTVALAPTTPDGAAPALRVTAISGGDSWVSQLTLPVVAAAPVVTTTTWSSGVPVAGTSGELEITIRNDGARSLAGGVATLRSHSPYVLLDGSPNVTIGALPVGGSEILAFPLAIRDDCFSGHLAAFELEIATDSGSVHELGTTLGVGTVGLDSPTGPDSYGYLAFDNLDPDPRAPVYNWIEIDPNYGGFGGDVGLSDFSYEGDDTETLPLPFTFRYYGQDFDEISICSNGWVAFGATSLCDFHNRALPFPGTPNPFVAVFWDDLRQSGTNKVYSWHDAAGGRYIVQWSRMRNRANGIQNCELVLYDPAQHPTLTGDGLIVFQYDAVNNNDSSRSYATTGIQNLDGTDGITWTYWYDYAPGARTLQSGRAIAWVPTPRLTADAASVDPTSLVFALESGEQETQSLMLSATGETGALLSYAIAAVEGDGLAPPAPADGADKQALPGVTVESPNGGETWFVGEEHAITWSADETVGSVRIDLDRGLGGGWENLVLGVPGASGAWPWTVDGEVSDECLIRVRDLQDVLAQDTSDAPFAIARDLSWVAIAPASGYVLAGESVPVEVTVDATGILDGTYHVVLVIQHNAGAPLTVPLVINVGVTTDVPDLPASVALAPAHPNPFNPRCEIRFALPRDLAVRLTIHDLTGRRVADLVDGPRSAGTHTVIWEGEDDAGRRLASGPYLLRLDAGGEVRTQKLMLVK